MPAPVSRSARLVLEDQLGLDDEAYSEIADGYATGSSARRGVAVSNSPASSVSALQLVLETMYSAPTPPVPRDRGQETLTCFPREMPCRVARYHLYRAPLGPACIVM